MPLLRDPSDRVREALAGALGAAWCEEVKAALMPMTSDPDLSIRRAARTAFTQSDDRDVLDVLERALLDHERVLRQEAVSAIGRVDDERAVSMLVDVLAGSDETIRFLAAQELGRHTWAPHVVERVIQALLAATSDADDYVRACAISALKYALTGYRMRDDFHITVVNAVAPSLHEKEVGARYGAADTLGRIGGVHAARALVSGLDDDEAHVRRMVAVALSIVAEPVTRGPIAAQLAREPDETTRAALQRALDLIDQKNDAGRR
jgi:HEAT repeat protein